MANKSGVVQVKECRCGKRLEVWRGQAGMLIHCPDCQEEMTVDSVSMWNSSNSTKKIVSRSRPTQFSLLALLMLFVPFALVAWIVGLIVGLIEGLIGWELALLVAGYFLFVFGAISLGHYLATFRNWIWDTISGEEPETD